MYRMLNIVFETGRVIGIFLIVLGLFIQSIREARGITEDLPEDVHCLAQNIYFEARSEPLEGKLAVAHVVLNRAADHRFPDEVCDVVKQGGESRRHRCQFSWWCDGRSDHPHEEEAWLESVVLAILVRTRQIEDPTGGALWYHATYVRPSWAMRLHPVALIGTHVFYGDE